ncbi:MAG: prepilin-type N-terminal cleavage/methylation domain-containing protein [Candidatus Omnitrophota bacterium]
MNTKSHSLGFSFIEMVVVIVILGIISAVALVRFVDMHKRTQPLREDLIIDAARTTILFHYSKDNSWPTANPLTIIDNSPPYVEGCPTLDGETWGAFLASEGYWRIFSPSSTYCLGEPSGSGKEWRYFYEGPRQGQLIKIYDGDRP